MLASFDGGATVAARLDLGAGTMRAACIVTEGDGGDNESSDGSGGGSGGGSSGLAHWGEACAPPAPPLAGATPGPIEPPPPMFIATSARCDGGTVVVSLGEGAPAAQLLRAGQGLTLIHFSAQPEPSLTQNTP
jgi:E3 ubiquitin-protein ligase UBR4